MQAYYMAVDHTTKPPKKHRNNGNIYLKIMQIYKSHVKK